MAGGARASKIKVVNGRIVSAKSKTGDPACSQAMSDWKRNGMSPAVALILAHCRQKAKQNRGAEAKQASGKLAAGRGTWQRSDRARQLIQERAARAQSRAQRIKEQQVRKATEAKAKTNAKAAKPKVTRVKSSGTTKANADANARFAADVELRGQLHRLRDNVGMIDPKKARPVVADWIKANRANAREEIQEHGMTSPEKYDHVTWEGTKFHFPADQGLDDPHHPLVSTLRGLASVPEIPHALKRHTRRVIFTKQANAADRKWAQRYNEPGFQSAATGGDGNVVVYHGVGTGYGVLAHEMAHNMARKVYGQVHPPEHSDFHKAAQHKGESPTSDYARHNIGEDFAEAIRAHHETPISFAANHPRRHAVIKRLLEDPNYGG